MAEPLSTLVPCLRQLDVGAQEPSWILMADAKERVRSVREIWLGDDSPRVLRPPERGYVAGGLAFRWSPAWDSGIDDQAVLRAYRILSSRAIRGVFVWFEDAETRARVERALLGE